MKLNGSRMVGLARQGGVFADPVGRYLSNAILGSKRIAAATIEQEGEFRLGTGESRWRRFTATERFTTGRPRFEWDAKIRLAPLVNIDVRDAYVIGAGSIRATLFGVPFVHQHGKPELNEGALQRYLAEAVWFPTSLLPSPDLTWESINQRDALASIRDRKLSASLLFRVNDEGEVTDMLSPRYRATNKGFVLTPWAVRCRDYFDVDEFRIPRRCEVEWLLPEGPMTYCRVEVTRVRYELERLRVPRARAVTQRARPQPIATSTSQRRDVGGVLAQA